MPTNTNRRHEQEEGGVFIGRMRFGRAEARPSRCGLELLHPAAVGRDGPSRRPASDAEWIGGAASRSAGIQASNLSLVGTRPRRVRIFGRFVETSLPQTQIDAIGSCFSGGEKAKSPSSVRSREGGMKTAP